MGLCHSSGSRAVSLRQDLPTNIEAMESFPHIEIALILLAGSFGTLVLSLIAIAIRSISQPFAMWMSNALLIMSISLELLFVATFPIDEAFPLFALIQPGMLATVIAVLFNAPRRQRGGFPVSVMNKPEKDGRVEDGKQGLRQ
jgi:hypothetical protein